MSFALYTLLTEDSPMVSIDSLAKDLELLFNEEKGCSMEFEQVPFVNSKNISLQWNGWLVRVWYEEGENVLEDSKAISDIAKVPPPREISGVARRIRVVFGSDESHKFTNQAIEILQFLKEIPGSVVFDPQQKNFA